MTFRALPVRLQAYIALNVLLLVPAGAAVHHSAPPTSIWVVAALLLFTILFSTWKVELTVLQAKMTLTFAIVCLAQLLQGLQVAVVCAALGAFLGTYLRPVKGSWRVTVVHPPLHRAVFNACNCALSCTLSALVYRAMENHAPAPGDVGMVLGLTAFTGCYFLLNTLGVSLAIALQQNLGWLVVWQQNFLWTAPGYFASASAAAAIQAASGHLGVWALMFLPWLYIVYYSYRLYMDRINKDMVHIQELNRLNRSIISSLATAIDAKDRYTCAHINRVHHYAVALAGAAGLKGLALEAVGTAALVHDIGKLGIPDRILGKPGKLTPDEFERIQSHVAIGTEILSPIPFPFPVVDVVRTHHERWDGLGYPNGLKGEQIPIGGRIIAIVDVFDAVTSNRPYRRAMTEEEALEVLQEGAGKQFDPSLIRMFARILPRLTREIQTLEQAAMQRAEAARQTEQSGSALVRIGQAAAEMAAVCDVAHSLSEEETLEGVFRVVVSRARALLPVDTAALYVRVENEPLLVVAAVNGKYQEKLLGMTVQAGEGVSGWVAASQKPRVNVSASLDIARRFGPEENIDLSAATAVPLVHGADSLGVLTIYTTAYSVVTEHHLHVLNILAEHAAAAILNLRRFERHREMAYTDPLTGLVNSRRLFRHLERLIMGADGPAEKPAPTGDRRSGSDRRYSGEPRFALVMVDLDGFKNVNDRLGHLRGDDLLRTVADSLASLARPEDLVCRYAGDEFVVVLQGATADQAVSVAERVRAAIAAIGPVDGLVEITASVGVAAYPEEGDDGRTLIQVADRRMYEDKFERRGQKLLSLPEVAAEA